LEQRIKVLLTQEEMEIELERDDCGDDISDGDAKCL